MDTQLLLLITHYLKTRAEKEAYETAHNIVGGTQPAGMDDQTWEMYEDLFATMLWYSHELSSYLMGHLNELLPEYMKAAKEAVHGSDERLADRPGESGQ